ncbi:EAL domain-containing protein [Phyllobacterium zundukense]|uniref:EAL domain-containing protein n=1 Tax=Phyllobacterium zundukense TaxID=1867719 RepID=A0ACD4CXY9_9HYPH|nr:EAL domain-containing protein [Phyllobacterium zundukense]UXN58382.1 EAL domain-containing protein [Phyllobacterium zundukense]
MLQLQNTILEMIATGSSLKETLDCLCREVETLVPRMVCSVVAVDHQRRLRPLAGPTLPLAYSSAFDGIEIGPFSGSCGTAAYYQEAVSAIDIETDVRWRDFKALVHPLGFKACWSTPILNADRVVATFAFYYFDQRGPSELEENIVGACVHLCSIAFERHERVKERQRLTYTDALTGLGNRARFNEKLIEQGLRRPFGILLADIDNLKMVNDTFGHSAGDDLIKVVADRLMSVTGSDLIFRLGGDEFAIVVGHQDGSDLKGEALTVLSVLEQPCSCNGHVVFPKVTIGGATSEPGDSPDDVRRKADIALYHGKEQNRGRFVEYHGDQGTALTRRFHAIRQVSQALADDRISPHYQPIIRLGSTDLAGFEALCRITTATGEIIEAVNFNEATKDAHVAAELTQRMMTLVAADVRRWLDMDVPFHSVAINLSASDFHTGNLKERVCEIFGWAGVPLQHIVLEITESVYLGQQEDFLAREIKSLRDLGLHVALDDFGTGFASLTHLMTVPVDIIKIDQTFVKRLVPGDPAIIITEGLLEITAGLGIDVIAEGIETSEQARQLHALGCEFGQGYFFSKAVDWEAATRLLRPTVQAAARTS